MNKSKNFSGQPIISQVLKFIPASIIARTAKKQMSDRYYKRFKTYDHLVTMIFATLSGSSSLREVSSIMLACEGKINHLGLSNYPKRSTLSDANKKRSSSVFAAIYQSIYNQYKHFLSDSNPRTLPLKDLKIVDSSTISLFSDVLKGAGRNPLEGKKKGGIKMHTMINAREDVPCLVRFTSAATHDHTFLKELDLKKGSFVVFDKGYVDYLQYHNWTLDDIYFVTRQKDNAVYQSLEEFPVGDHIHSGVLKDERIEVLKDKQTITLRRVAFYHAEQDRVYEFISNNFELAADKIAEIYKQRWQIETLFKRLKQNFPLKYFLGDNQNAIEIQIWVSLIIGLIMLVIQRKAKRKWAFSNMMSVIRYHLMTYIDLFKFLKKPDGDWRDLNNVNQNQLSLFQT
jgi:hypothetical protein|uniref:IS4 family transposase n=1 Tax=Daejeonella sp. TaxID=2805397 RepID=UPI0040496FB6